MGLDASRDVCRWAHTDSRVKRGWRGGLWFGGPTSAHITLLYGGMGAVMGPPFHLSSAAFCFSLFLWTLEQTIVSHVCRERERERESGEGERELLGGSKSHYCCLLLFSSPDVDFFDVIGVRLRVWVPPLPPTMWPFWAPSSPRAFHFPLRTPSRW